ncbi:hypothetical protein [Xanthomonas phage BUDD]|nr:hypothetical protein [Xanthomonas phage BUDD]
MKFEDYLAENTDHTHLHVLMNSKSDRTHRGGGKDLAKAHGGQWHSFYSSSNNTQGAVHVIKVHKDHAQKAKSALEKEHDVNHVAIHHSSEKIL